MPDQFNFIVIQHIKSMTEFILNDRTIRTSRAASMTLLDYIRYDQALAGTKIGCREGDCGACTILLGREFDGQMYYESMTSCITPLGNAAGKHVVTIEGLNMDDLAPVQQFMVKCGGTQCGFCTVGFVVSLSGYCLSTDQPTVQGAISTVDGNICRCTGYKSIERAAEKLVSKLEKKALSNPVPWLVENGFLPGYFIDIPERLSGLKEPVLPDNGSVVVGGGTDLYVQQHDELVEQEEVELVLNKPDFKSIIRQGDTMTIGAAATATDLMQSQEMNEIIPNLYSHLKLVSSTPIRNMGTIAGNLVNASPIGDLTVFFLALDSKITLRSNVGKERELPLKDFFIGYKKLDKEPDENLVRISFPIPSESRFNFEKVSKRTYLDIASVNTAIGITVSGGIIEGVHLSAGGVGPTPMFLQETCSFLTGKVLSEKLLAEANEVIQSEVSPISDVRGSADYKRTLLRQLFFAHFAELYPEHIEAGELI